MGSGLSTEEKREIVPTPRVNRYNEPQESHPALVHGAQQTGTIPEHGQLRGTNTQRTRPATPRPKHVKVKSLPALPCSITNRLLTGKRPMPDISFCGVKYKSSYEFNHLSFRDRYDIPVTGEPGDKLLRLVRRVIEAVMRFHTDHSIHAYVDSLSPYTVLVETSKKLDWTEFIKPCLDDALGAFEALRIFGLTERRFEKFVNGLDRKDRNLLAKLLNPVDRRIEFHCDLRGHASVVVIAEKPDDALINNLIAWIFELRKIGAFDAIFAILDKLDLSMVGEFHDLSEYKPRSWQDQLVDCYRGLTGASLRELGQRRWINFNDLIADLKTELIIGLCDAESGYCDPVMAAKVMLRQARDNPHSGELATGDIVIEALIAIGIPLKDLEKVLGRRNGRSEELWWDKLERRLKDPDRDVDRARPPQLGVSEDSLPRFSLDSVHRYNAERWIRLHKVKPKSPIKGVVDYILQELVKAVAPGSITKVRSYEHEEKFLISFAYGDADETLSATAGAESMFWSFANFGISEEKVAEFFAGHREIETADLFSHGISRLLATPHKSHFAIVAFPDRFELVDKDVKDDEQRLDRAQHLSETIADLEWFGLPTAAATLVPLLRSDLESLWPGKSLDWAKLALPDLRRVLQILIELRSPPPSAQEHDELAPQESEEPPPQQRHVWRRAV